jgi:hypothetical protein
VTTGADREEPRARAILTSAIVIALSGIALAGTMSRTFGGVLVVAGWLALVYSLHAFGRAGSER